MSQTTAFWNDREAFLFLAVNTTGRSRNFPQQKLADTRYGYLTVFFGAFSDFSKQEVIAYHLLPMGQLDSFALPEQTAASGSWGLVDGQLQLSPPRGGNNKGFRWDGEKFVAVVAQPAASMQPSPATTDKNLAADDLENNEEDEGSGLLSKAERKTFKDAGWHYKSLTGYEASGAVATLPIALWKHFQPDHRKFPTKEERARALRFPDDWNSSHPAGGGQAFWRLTDVVEPIGLARSPPSRLRSFAATVRPPIAYAAAIARLVVAACSCAGMAFRQLDPLAFHLRHYEAAGAQEHGYVVLFPAGYARAVSAARPRSTGSLHARFRGDGI